MYEDAAAARYPNTPPPGTSPQDTYAQQPWPATHPMPAWQAPPGPHTTIPQPPDPQFPPQNAHHLHPSVPWLPPGQPPSWQIQPGRQNQEQESEMPDWVKTFLIFVGIVALTLVLQVILPEEVWDFLLTYFSSGYRY